MVHGNFVCFEVDGKVVERIYPCLEVRLEGKTP